VNSYAGVLSGAFVRVGGVLVGTRAECSLHQRRLAQQRYVQRHPDVRAAEVVRFRQMRLGYVVLDTPVLVSDTVYACDLSQIAVLCCVRGSFESQKRRSQEIQGKKKNGRADPTPSIPI